MGCAAKARIAAEFDLRLLGRLMRMRAYREVNIWKSFRYRDQTRALSDAGGDRHQALDACRLRALDDRRQFVREVGEVQMTMTVDELRHALASGST